MTLDTAKLTRDDVKDVICDVLKVDQVSPEDAMGSVRGWDSFCQITLVLAIEEAVGVRLPGDAFGRMTSVQAIMDVLAEEGVFA